MTGRALQIPGLVALLVLALACAVAFGEVPLSAAQYLDAFRHPSSPAGEILWSIRAPRTLAAAVVGAALGLAGAVMQGLLRNPLADPAVLGVSAFAGLGASVAIAAGLALAAGAVEGAALAGALGAGAVVAVLAGRFREPEVLILFGVALSAFGGALTALVFNLSPSPVATAEVLSWLLGSVENRDWGDIAWTGAPMALGAGFCAWSARGLAMLSLGEETAAVSGLPMARLRAAAVAGAALLTAADLIGRLIPSEVELKLGVVTALFGAPLFALAAWRASRSWRA